MVIRLIGKESNLNAGSKAPVASVTVEVTEASLMQGWAEWNKSAAGIAALNIARRQALKTFAAQAVVCLVVIYAGLRLWVLDDRVVGFVLSFLSVAALISCTKSVRARPRLRFSTEYLDYYRRSGYLDGMLGPVEYTASDSGIAIRQRHLHRFVPWPSIRVVARHGAQVRIEMKFITDVMIDVGAFGGEQAADDWVRRCEELRSAAPKGPPDPIARQLLNLDFACQSCGYNLRGSARGTCPECGWVVDFVP